MSKIKTASFLGFVAIVTGALNYLSYPIFIKYLSESDYVQVMMYASILSIISIPSSAFGYALLEIFRSSDRDALVSPDFFKKLQKFSLYHGIFLLLSIIVALFALKIPFSSLAFFVFLAVFPSLFVAYFSAYIQSREYFYMIGFFTLVASSSRFFLSLGIIFFPSALLWVFVFLTPLFIAALCYSFFWKKILATEKVPQKNQHFFSFREKISSFFHYILISAIYILLQSADNIFVKMLFSVSETASYLSASVLVKFSLVIIGIFETLSLPILFDKKNAFFKKYLFSLVFLMIFGFFASFALLPFLGNFVLWIIKNGLEVSYFVWAFLGVSLVSLWFFSIFVKILISRHIWFYTIFIVPSIVFFGLFFASSLDLFIMIFSAMNVSLLGGVLVLLYKNRNFLQESSQ